MGNLIKFPQVRTRTITPRESHALEYRQNVIRAIRSKYYNENLEQFKKGYAYSLMVQRVVKFVRNQWVTYDN